MEEAAAMEGRFGYDSFLINILFVVLPFFLLALWFVVSLHVPFIQDTPQCARIRCVVYIEDEDTMEGKGSIELTGSLKELTLFVCD